MFTELTVNKGPSVTNAIEDIATIFFETRPDLFPEDVVIIERYEDRPAEFDLVKLDRRDRSFSNPRWSRLGEFSQVLSAAFKER